MPSFLGLNKPIVAMVHFPPLPGSPLYDRDGGMAAIVEHAARDIPVQRSEYFYWDLQAPSPVFFQEFFSRYSKTGTLGDPTKATVEKGRRFVEAVTDRLIALIRELRNREILPRADHH